MKRCITILITTACLAIAAAGPAAAQGPGGAGPCVGIRNELKTTVIVQGYSVVGGNQRRGQPLVLPFGKAACELNIPPGVRYYNVYDANQPSRVLLRDFPVPLHGGDLFLLVRPGAAPGRVVLVPDFGPAGPGPGSGVLGSPGGR